MGHMSIKYTGGNSNFSFKQIKEQRLKPEQMLNQCFTGSRGNLIFNKVLKILHSFLLWV